MKLLIVDDESHVREGMLSMIDWEAAHVDEIVTAKNGKHGLELALTFEPNIVLTDVRMPKMDGIEMAFAVREAYPDCSIIFMSGYSDKEYLKSAIQLSAISYVEKPIELEELFLAVTEAVKVQDQLILQRKRKEEINGRLEISMEALKNQLVQDLTKKNFQTFRKSENIAMAFPNIDAEDEFITIIVDIVGYKPEGGNVRAGHPIDGARSVQSNVVNLLKTEFETRGIKVLAGRKEEHMIILHIDLGKKEDQGLRQNPERIVKWMEEVLNEVCYCFLAIGNQVSGIYDIYESYNNAASVLLQSFYYETGQVLYYKDEKEGSFILAEHYLTKFTDLLRHGSFEEAVEYIQELIKNISSYPQTFIYAVKEFFCRIMQQLLEVAGQKGIVQFEEELQYPVQEMFWEFRFLSQIEAYLIEQLEIYFDNIREPGSRQTISDKVKYYVACHYSEPDLSLSTVADKLSLTSSYLCIIFKKECQMTLTSYIIQYRMEWAKKYLEDESRKIKDIALMTGYIDCNYFIKVFKKWVGETPAEYRKKVNV